MLGSARSVFLAPDPATLDGPGAVTACSVHAGSARTETFLLLSWCIGSDCLYPEDVKSSHTLRMSWSACPDKLVCARTTKRVDKVFLQLPLNFEAPEPGRVKNDDNFIVLTCDTVDTAAGSRLQIFLLTLAALFFCDVHSRLILGCC